MLIYFWKWESGFLFSMKVNCSLAPLHRYVEFFGSIDINPKSCSVILFYCAPRLQMVNTDVDTMSCAGPNKFFIPSIHFEGEKVWCPRATTCNIISSAPLCVAGNLGKVHKAEIG